MGNENSSLIDEHTAPLKLSERSLSAVARHIKDGRAQKIVVMTGAGLSTAAGSKSPSIEAGQRGHEARLRCDCISDMISVSPRLPLPKHRPLRQPR